MLKQKMLAKRYRDLKKQIDDLTDELEGSLPFDNKILDACLKDQIHIELKTTKLLNKTYRYNEWAKEEVEIMYSKVFSGYVNNSYRSFTPTEIKAMINANYKYIRIKKLSNKFKYLYEMMKEISSIVETRKYTLKTLNDSMIHGVNSTIL